MHYDATDPKRGPDAEPGPADQSRHAESSSTMPPSAPPSDKASGTNESIARMHERRSTLALHAAHAHPHAPSSAPRMRSPPSAASIAAGAFGSRSPQNILRQFSPRPKEDGDPQNISDQDINSYLQVLLDDDDAMATTSEQHATGHTFAPSSQQRHAPTRPSQSSSDDPSSSTAASSSSSSLSSSSSSSSSLTDSRALVRPVSASSRSVSDSAAGALKRPRQSSPSGFSPTSDDGHSSLQFPDSLSPLGQSTQSPTFSGWPTLGHNPQAPSAMDGLFHHHSHHPHHPWPASPPSASQHPLYSTRDSSRFPGSSPSPQSFLPYSSFSHMDASLDGGINSHAAGGPPEHGTSASHHFAHTNPYSNPYAPEVHHARRHRPPPSTHQRNPSAASLSSSSSSSSSSSAAMNVDEQDMPMEQRTRRRFEDADALQNPMMANATTNPSYASAITHHARQGAATMLSSVPTLMGSHASSGGVPEPLWPSSELNRRGSSASSAAEDSDDQQTSAGGAVGASARGQVLTSSAGGTAGFKYRKGKWNIEEEILLLHVVYCFIDRELKDIAVIAYHCGISRSSRAIDKKLKRVVYFEKWKKRDIPDMHAKLAAVLEKRGWTNLNASGQAVIANARRQAALRREASFAPVYASAEEQQHGPTLLVDHHDGSLR